MSIKSKVFLETVVFLFCLSVGVFCLAGPEFNYSVATIAYVFCSFLIGLVLGLLLQDQL